MTVPSNASDSAPGVRMVVTALCGSSSCPTIYRSDRGTMLVQGHVVPAERAGVTVPDGEMLVEIPIELFRDAVPHFMTPEESAAGTA